MKDRQPLHAGRVHLAPVNGQQNTFDMTMADGATEQGTPLNKANLLKDATAALYGLTNAVPDDVFSWLGKYNEYCWAKYTTEPTIVKKYNASELKVGSTAAKNFQYSTSVSLVNGQIVLDNPQTITVSSDMYTAASQLSGLAPCYMKNASTAYTKYFYMPVRGSHGDAAATIYATDDSLYISGLCAENLRAMVLSIAGERLFLEAVFSTNRNAYPDSGIQDGYEYEYIGVPFDNLTKVHAKIETGSYVGTGTYGASNPNSITFSFKPKLIIMLGYERDGNWYQYFGRYQDTTKHISAINCDVLTNQYRANCGFTFEGQSANAFGKLDGNTYSWYHTASPYLQCNGNSATYYWLAIG